MIFLTLYPISSEYRVILPKSNQTIFDAPPGFIYRGSTLLVVPSTQLLLSCAKLMVVSPLTTSSEGSSICVELVITRIEGWHEWFFYVQDSIIPANVRVFPDPILFLAGLKPSWEYGQQRPAIMATGKEMAFRNFIYAEDDEELSFLPN
ncbi:hypothetical protein Tco_1105804 [Tanacetum coccineum]